MNTLDKLKEIIKEEMDVTTDVTLETDLRNDLEADSLALMEMVMAIEEEFDVKIEDDKLGDLVTVGDIVKLIDSQK
jgi:acyl carrier protein